MASASLSGIVCTLRAPCQWQHLSLFRPNRLPRSGWLPHTPLFRFRSNLEPELVKVSKS
jgi:hypothetical protein